MGVMALAKAKANLLTLVKEVEGKRESFTLTRNGRPVAKLVPFEAEENPLAVFHFSGISVRGDVIAPAFDEEDWEQTA